mmetsp:Transcript_10361/g.17778  ORF Transcript_10361/g.17778 Transcript_10361/m.17778 type:complete len:148 (+) Transcript_10361:608-1051(+)
MTPTTQQQVKDDLQIQYLNIPTLQHFNISTLEHFKPVVCISPVCVRTVHSVLSTYGRSRLFLVSRHQDRYGRKYASYLVTKIISSKTTPHVSCIHNPSFHQSSKSQIPPKKPTHQPTVQHNHHTSTHPVSETMTTICTISKTGPGVH